MGFEPHMRLDRQALSRGGTFGVSAFEQADGLAHQIYTGLASECSLDDNYVYEAHCRQKMIVLPIEDSE